MIKAQLSMYDIDEKKVRVAMVTFSDKPRVIHQLENNNNKNDVFKKLFSIKKSRGIGNLTNAIEFVHQNVVRKRNRKQVPIVVLAVTSKNPRLSQENGLKTASTQLKDSSGAKFIVVTLDPKGLVGEIDKLSNVVGGSIAPSTGDLTDVFDDTIGAVKKATGLFCVFFLLP